MAAAVGLLYGVKLTDIVRGLEQLERIPGRMERVECGQPFGVFVDYAHTPDALASVLRSLRAVTPGRLICVFGAGGQRDRAKRPLMAQAVEAASDLAVMTDDNPRREDPAKIRRDHRARLPALRCGGNQGRSRVGNHLGTGAGSAGGLRADRRQGA